MFNLISNGQGAHHPYREWIIGAGTTAAVDHYCTPGYWPVIVPQFWRTAVVATGLAAYSGDGGRFSLTSGTAGPNWQALVEGWCPHSVVDIPFGDQLDPNDWYDLTRPGLSAKLTMKGGSSVGTSQTAQVFVQQLQKYGGR